MFGPRTDRNCHNFTLVELPVNSSVRTDHINHKLSQLADNFAHTDPELPENKPMQREQQGP